jgi:prephenate dehydrogenase
LKVAILGSSGGMGRLFANYFIKKGHTVFGYDPRIKAAKGLEIKNSSIEAVREADLTVIATPLGTEVEVLDEIRNHLKKGSYVIEISSIKQNLAVLKKMIADSTLLSIHPLFGPKVKSLKNKKMVVIGNVRDAKIVSSFFPEVNIVNTDAEEHDRMMALMLCLPYALNAAYFAFVLKRLDRWKLESFLTATAEKQMKLAKRVLSQNPSFLAKVLMMNRYSGEYIKEFSDEILSIVRTIDGDGYLSLLDFARHLNRLSKMYR